jgi:hypothetical protein
MWGMRGECDCCGQMTGDLPVHAHGPGDLVGPGCHNAQCRTCGGPCRGTPFAIRLPAHTLAGYAGNDRENFRDHTLPDLGSRDSLHLPH